MSKSILLIGESGTGKTTSMRTLDPKTTFYIDCDGKGLSWKGWREQYNNENKNYWSALRANTKEDTVAELIMRIMVKISDEQKEIKTIIIDTLNTLMLDREMRDQSKSFQKWSDIAHDGYGLCMMANRLRDDLTVIITGHAETITEETGRVFTRMKTNGRKLEKIVLESLFTTVLISDIRDGEYVFITREENTTAKAPLGAFETPTIPNDMAAVLTALEDF